MTEQKLEFIDHNWWSVYYSLVIYSLPFNHTYSCHVYCNKWPLGQARLHTPYVTPWYTKHIQDIDDKDELEVVEVAHRRLAAE
jgi:hypothetical protein